MFTFPLHFPPFFPIHLFCSLLFSFPPLSSAPLLFATLVLSSPLCFPLLSTPLIPSPFFFLPSLPFLSSTHLSPNFCYPLLSYHFSFPLPFSSPLSIIIHFYLTILLVSFPSLVIPSPPLCPSSSPFPPSHIPSSLIPSPPFL